ncbi:uncharacterized protein [Asterias amurensis]|uniref:uncharacterized protein n=1 Tax=Asterias amurensis TaxID=7602 RepID=UPI003AB408DD
MAEKDSEKQFKLRCYAHSSDSNEAIKPITETTWTKFTQCVKTWQKLDGKFGEIARCFLQDHGGDDTDCAALPIPNDGGFHRKCYQLFTDISKLQRAVRTKENRDKEPEPKAKDLMKSSRIVKKDSEPPRKKVRMIHQSSSTLNMLIEETLSSTHTLPRICILCHGNQYRKDCDGKRNKQPLSQCTSTDGGNLLKAAQLKKDENLLLHIANKDCVAMQVRYHSVCYGNYTKCVTKRVSKPPRDPLYFKSFKVFCEKYIVSQIINDKQVLRMSKLKREFDKVVREVDDDDSSTYRASNLKNRLKKTFPELCFMKPKRVNTSEFVYVLPKGLEILPCSEGGWKINMR